MKLEEFVAETTIQVVRGVRHAQGPVRDDGGIVNPVSVKEVRRGTLKTTEIEFDIAVTTTEGTQTKGGIGVFVAGVGLGSQGRSEMSSANMSRIRFSVPVEFPLAE
jgi:hypothetical protein